jgi:hypothetical protein
MPMTILPPPVFAKAQTSAASPSQRCSRVLSRYPDPTHVLNPGWSAHARFHEVWLLEAGGLLAPVAIYFIWIYRERPQLGITLAGVLVRRLVRRILSCLGNRVLVRRDSHRSCHCAAPGMRPSRVNSCGDWQQDITGYRHWLLRPDLHREYVRGSSNSQTHSS